MLKLAPFVLAACTAALASAPLSPREGRFDSGGVSIRYLDAGQGDAVVLVHGFGGSAEEWTRAGVFQDLATDHRVLALDLRGHGRSGKPRDPAKYGLEVIEDVVRLLDHLKIRKAHVVGYSMGARLTAKLMILHPERLHSVVLGGGGARRDSEEERRNIEDLARSLERGEGIRPVILRTWPANAPPPTPEQIREASEAFLKGQDALALAAMTRGRTHWFVSAAELRNNRVPALGIAGTADSALGEVKATAAEKANMRVLEIDGASHEQAMHRSELVAAVRSFLAGFEEPAPRGTVRMEAAELDPADDEPFASAPGTAPLPSNNGGPQQWQEAGKAKPSNPRSKTPAHASIGASP